MPRKVDQPIFRKPTPFDSAPGYCPSRTIAVQRRLQGLSTFYPLYKLPPEGLEDRLGHTLEEITIALRLDALTAKGRYDGAFFKKSSVERKLSDKRRHTRMFNKDLVSIRLYRRDLIELLDNPCTEDEVFLCEGEWDLSCLFDKINPAELNDLQIKRIQSRYSESFEDYTSDSDLFAKFIAHQLDLNNARRAEQGKPSLPDLAVYTSLYDALGFGQYNRRPLGDRTTRYEAARDKFPESLAYLGLGPKIYTEVPKDMYSDLTTLPKAFRQLERFLEGLHRKYQLPLMTSYRSGLFFPVDSHVDEIIIEGQSFVKNSAQCPKLFHRGIVFALINDRDDAMRAITRAITRAATAKECDHRSLLEILAKHGILDEIEQPGFGAVVGQVLRS